MCLTCGARARSVVTGGGGAAVCTSHGRTADEGRVDVT